MAKRGKKPEEYGQLSLFEATEPEWLKPVDPLGYTLDPQTNAAADFPFDNAAAISPADPADENDDLVQFAEWLARNKAR